MSSAQKQTLHNKQTYGVRVCTLHARNGNTYRRNVACCNAASKLKKHKQKEIFQQIQLDVKLDIH